MHTKKELDQRMLEAGVQPLKKLGQNFFVNPEICRRVIEQIHKLNPKSVIEIGPGLGALTDDLLKGPWKTVLVEVDAGLVKHWMVKFPAVEVIHQDALKINWVECDFPKPSML